MFVSENLWARCCSRRAALCSRQEKEVRIGTIEERVILYSRKQEIFVFSQWECGRGHGYLAALSSSIGIGRLDCNNSAVRKSSRKKERNDIHHNRMCTSHTDSHSWFLLGFFSSW